MKDSSIFPDNTIKVSGRFVHATQVKGKIKWTTTDDCPAGVYRFSFRADRYAAVG